MPEVVPMRTPSGDCTIAALATVLDCTYERAAEILGIELDSAGIPDRDKWPFNHLNGDATLAAIHKRLEQSEIRAVIIDGIWPALLAMILEAVPWPTLLIIESDEPADAGKLHVLAYRDGRVIDSRKPDADITIGELTIYRGIVFNSEFTSEWQRGLREYPQ